MKTTTEKTRQNATQKIIQTNINSASDDRTQEIIPFNSKIMVRKDKSQE